MGNGEWGMGNGEWGMGNREWGIGNRESKTPRWLLSANAGHNRLVLSWLWIFAPLELNRVFWDLSGIFDQFSTDNGD
ncbi:hypothetical protein PL11201_30028 [Planktothrix sp. PCC 11201]|nr:hypothetical protein PL11201_30028 [Planktothrix sp. PCC 11201]